MMKPTSKPSAAGTVTEGGPAYGSASLAPGAYDGVEVKPYATLTLTAGTYTMDSLDVSTSATLAVDTQQGPVLVYVRSALTWRGAETQTGPTGSFLVAYLGTAPAYLYQSLHATVLAPNATLHLKNDADYHGVYWGKNLEVIARAHVVHEPFNYWGMVFPPTPTFKCVTRFNDTPRLQTRRRFRGRCRAGRRCGTGLFVSTRPSRPIATTGGAAFRPAVS